MNVSDTRAVEETAQGNKAVVYRMVTDKHICPFGIKAVDLLKRSVRRHIKWHRLWARLRETLLIMLVDTKRRLCGIASVGVR
jgi:hypothetical protein